jgi:hypothetical protein
MLRLKDLQWSCNSKCDTNLHAIFHIEMIVLRIFHCKHSRLDQHLCVFWWCQDWRISNLVIPECRMNLHTFFYIEVIKVAPLIATTIWCNNKETCLYIHESHSSHLKVRPLALCIIQIITTIPIIEMYVSIASMFIFNPNASYTTIENRHF